MSGLENNSSISGIGPADPRGLESVAKEAIETRLKDGSLGSHADGRGVVSVKRGIVEQRGRFLVHNLRLQLR